MAKNGNMFFVKATIGSDSTLIAGAKSDDIEVKCDLQEIASPTQGQWREFLAGRKEWTVNTSYLVSAGTDLSKVIAAGMTFAVSFIARNTSEALQGTAILTTCKIQATRGSLATGMFQFKGTGVLTYVNP